jgi:hypothetical protein
MLRKEPLYYSPPTSTSRSLWHTHCLFSFGNAEAKPDRYWVSAPQHYLLSTNATTLQRKKSATCRDARSSTSLLVIAHCLHRQGDEDARVIRRFPVHEVRWLLLCISTLSVFMDRSLLTLPLLGPVSVDCGRLLLFPFRPLPVTIARRTSES